MFRLSAFADEISPDAATQIAVLAACGVKFIEFRSVDRTNVLALSDGQLDEFAARLGDAGIGLSAIGSPIGKVPIDSPFPAHFDKFQHAVAVAQRMGTPNIRVFSYYPPADAPFDGDWTPYRAEVFERMARKAEYAATQGIQLLHENEHRIFGDAPERVRDLFVSVPSPALRAAYDAANWVHCGYDPVAGWDLTAEFTTHLHIKDWLRGGEHGVLAGHGDGQLRYSITRAVAAGYDGFAVLEPHLRGGGPTGGVTGADLFPAAVEAFRHLLRECGGAEG